MEKQVENKNPLHSLGLCLVLMMIVLLNFAYRILSLNIEKVDLTSLTITFSEFKSMSGIILGTLAVLMSFLFSVPAHILTRKIIKQRYPKEIFQNSFYPLFLFMTCAQFFIGWLVGGIIIPAFAFFDYLSHDVFTYISLLAFIVFEIIAFYLFLTFQYYAIVLTNTQIVGISFCSSLKGEQVSLKDIKETKILRNGYEILANDGKILQLRARPFATRLYRRLNELLNIEESNV